jgi:uncharacterized membrane protein YfcA
MDIAILILIGLTAGVSSGIFGIGGGVLIVPALVFLLHYPMQKAVGTSLAVLLPPVGIAAVLTYYRAGQLEWRAALILAATVLIGAWIGALFATRLDENLLRILFGIFLLGLGVYTLMSARLM